MSKRTATIVSALIAILLSVATAHAGGPTAQLQSGLDRVFQTLSDPGLKGPERAAERRAAVFSIAETIFDFAEMAKIALGRQWDQLSAPDRNEFVPVFTTLIRRGYFSKLDLYDGEQVVYTAEMIDGDRATVRSRIVTKDGSQIPVDFRMMLKPDDRWYLYDVTIDGMSLVGNYRVQFQKVIRTSSYDDLVRKLKAKAD